MHFAISTETDFEEDGKRKTTDHWYNSTVQKGEMYYFL